MSEEVFLLGLTLMSGTLISLAWLVTRYLERRGARGLPGPDPQVDQQLEDMRGRLEGVEERLDFAERLLARQREEPRLPGQGA